MQGLKGLKSSNWEGFAITPCLLLGVLVRFIADNLMLKAAVKNILTSVWLF